MYGFASLWEASASSPRVINPYRRTNYLVYFISYMSYFHVVYVFFQIHLVHFKSKYGSIENANKFTDGRAVVAIFYKVVLQYMYSKICLKRPLKKKTQKMIFNTDYMSSLQCHSVPSTIAQVLRKMSLKILAS